MWRERTKTEEGEAGGEKQVEEGELTGDERSEESGNRRETKRVGETVR